MENSPKRPTVQDNDYPSMTATATDHDYPGQPQTLPEQRAPGPSRSGLRYEARDAATLPREFALLMIIVTLSSYLEFCWGLMLMSFLATYYYAKFAFTSLTPPRCNFFSRKMAGFIAGTTVRLGIQVGMLVWCLSITPFHVFVPVATNREPMKMTEVVYDPGQSASVDIVAVHGLGSIPDNAWTYRSNETKIRWLSELLPNTMGFEDARILMINHRTHWASDAAPIQFNDHAYAVPKPIDTDMSSQRTNPDRPIIFIAHSFGGLLLKKALLLAKSRPSNVAAMTRGIVFLGVPHRGTYAAFLASCISCLTFFRGSSSSLHEFMAVDGATILELETDFYDGYVIPYHAYQPQPYICDIIEMRSEQMGNLVLGPIVRQKYGLLRHGRIFMLDTSHRGLNKFYSHSDPNYVKLSGILLQAKTWALQPNPFLGPPKSQDEAPDLLKFLSSGMPWIIHNRIEAFALGGLQEYAATWLANDYNKQGNYLTRRVPLTAFYEGLIGVSIGQALYLLVFVLFQGFTSLTPQLLPIIVSGITIALIQRECGQVAKAVIAGARTYMQIRATIRIMFMKTIIVSACLYVGFIPVAYFVLAPYAWGPFFHFGFFLLDIYTGTMVKKIRLAAFRKKHYGNFISVLNKMDAGKKTNEEGRTGNEETPDGEINNQEQADNEEMKRHDN